MLEGTPSSPSYLIHQGQKRINSSFSTKGIRIHCHAAMNRDLFRAAAGARLPSLERTEKPNRSSDHSRSQQGREAVTAALMTTQALMRAINSGQKNAGEKRLMPAVAPISITCNSYSIDAIGLSRADSTGIFAGSVVVALETHRANSSPDSRSR